MSTLEYILIGIGFYLLFYTLDRLPGRIIALAWKLYLLRGKLAERKVTRPIAKIDDKPKTELEHPKAHHPSLLEKYELPYLEIKK